MWLMLNGFSLGQLLLGVLFGVGAPALLAPLRPARPRPRHPLTVLARLILAGATTSCAPALDVFWTLRAQVAPAEQCLRRHPAGAARPDTPWPRWP
jgi:multisubunit Na+/H+ antiporter MnhE subunit